MRSQAAAALIRPALYLHLPFCRGKCAYCSFNSQAVKAGAPILEAYLEALLQEMRRPERRAFLERVTLGSLYLGGGTPSLFSLSQLERLLGEVRRQATFAGDFECTVEVNPEHVTREFLSGLLRLGCNRLSLGVQSTAEEELRLLGRRTNRRQVRRALALATRCLANVNVDLICGLPGQKQETLAQSLEEVAAANPQHISLYDLQIDPGTELARRVSAGCLQTLPEEASLKLLTFGRARLSSLGFTAYEISNFSLPRRQCRHNLAYWRDQEYLGLGAGAHSFFKIGKRRFRQANEADPRRYIELIKRGTEPCRMREQLTPAEAAFDYLMTALRTTQGVRKKDFIKTFGTTLWPHEEVKCLQEEKLLAEKGGFLFLRPRGIVLSNEVFRRLLP